MIETVTIRLNDKAEFELTSHADCAALNPKEHFLYAAALCAGMTLQHVLKKVRGEAKGLELTVSGELSTPELMPESVFNSFNVIYNVECASLEEQTRAARAVSLTHEKYCGLMRMLRMIAPVSHEISVVSTEKVSV